jgi:hypothetical protein
MERTRRSQDDEGHEARERPREEPRPVPPTAGMALRMQQSAGNQAMGRMLSRMSRTLAREDYLSMVDKQPVTESKALRKAVEATIEDELGGIDQLFWQNGNMTSPSAWAEWVHGVMESRYDLAGVNSEHITPVIEDIKDDNREELLLRMANNLIYFAGVEVYTEAELVEQMSDRKAFLDVETNSSGEITGGADGPALKAIFNTEGATAVDQVEFDESTNIKLLDEDNVVVLLDAHQQKHQAPSARIALFGTYKGKKGSRFNKNKDLEWHRQNSAQIVKAKVLDAVAKKLVTENGAVYATPKVAEKGIVYDLGISYDTSTAKWVGSYHCNPVKNET